MLMSTILQEARKRIENKTNCFCCIAIALAGSDGQEELASPDLQLARKAALSLFTEMFKPPSIPADGSWFGPSEDARAEEYRQQGPLALVACISRALEIEASDSHTSPKSQSSKESDLTAAETPRGFKRVTFTDLYGETCSAQESSLASEDAIWLGCNIRRMHLNRETVAKLLPYLQTFVDTGVLVEEEHDDTADKPADPL